MIWAKGYDIWSRLTNQHIFLTGGTGFFGRSLLELINDFNQNHGLNLRITILTRDKTSFLKKYSHLCDSRWISFHTGDVVDFSFPSGDFDSILHFATPANATWNLTHPSEMFEVIVQGSKRVFEFAVNAKVKQVLFASSGAAYGKQSHDCTHIPESLAEVSMPNSMGSAYGEGKRVAEVLGTLSAKEHGFKFKIARCFAFVGPHLDPDGTYAMGNFIRDALRDKKIVIKGDGTSIRSYLYSDDLVLWLFKILLDGKESAPYNVGSDQDLSIKDLALKIVKVLGDNISIEILGEPKQDAQIERYVPSIELARKELNLDVFTPLESAIQMTATRYKEKGIL